MNLKQYIILFSFLLILYGVLLLSVNLLHWDSMMARQWNISQLPVKRFVSWPAWLKRWVLITNCINVLQNHFKSFNFLVMFVWIYFYGWIILSCPFQNCSSRESSLAELMVKEEELAQKEELVKCLQEELVQVRILLYFCIIFSLHWIVSEGWKRAYNI